MALTGRLALGDYLGRASQMQKNQIAMPGA
jgi:hypothetical protein